MTAAFILYFPAAAIAAIAALALSQGYSRPVGLATSLSEFCVAVAARRSHDHSMVAGIFMQNMKKAKMHRVKLYTIYVTKEILVKRVARFSQIYVVGTSNQM